MKILKKLMIVSVIIPCLYGWLLLAHAHAKYTQAPVSAGTGLHSDTSCPPTPTPPPGG